MKGKVFTAPEAQAILNGSKVMFREVIKPQPISSFISEGEIICDSSINAFMQFGSDEKYKNYCYHFGKTPYQVGQKIFVKEDFFGCPIYHKDAIFSARYMKQEHSRLTLLIKEIRVERLAEISRGDCMAEGCPFPNIAKETNPKEWFAEFWNTTHKKPEEKFKANPWVFVYNFEVVK